MMAARRSETFLVKIGWPRSGILNNELLEIFAMPSIAAEPEPAFDPVHPGELLADELDAMKLSLPAAARQLSMTRQTLHNILERRQAIKSEMALRIGRLVGNGPNLWLSMQRSWDVRRARG